MVLPELSWQIAYARLAWGLVLAALVLAAWPARWRLPRVLFIGVLAACGLLVALPGEASAAWHLALAFQYPSGLLLGLCAAGLVKRWRGPHARGLRGDVLLPLPAAGLLAVTGLLLYLDAFGLLSRGWYYGGFGPAGAPLAALLVAAACAAAIARGRHALQAGALLFAVALFSLARLPSGNLWDALLDPLLWAWSVLALLLAGLRSLRATLGRRSDADAEAEALAPALQAVGAEPFSPMKE